MIALALVSLSPFCLSRHRSTAVRKSSWHRRTTCVPGPVVFGRPGLRRSFAIAALSHSRCAVITRSAIERGKIRPPCCHSGKFMLAITYTFIHGEDALKELTVLEQTVLPVELKATLELAADFANASTAPATQASLRVCSSAQRRLTSRSAIAAVVHPGADVDRTHSTNRPALNGSSTILHSSTVWERKWDSIEN